MKVLEFRPLTVKVKGDHLHPITTNSTQPIHPNIRQEKQTHLHSNTTECCDSQ